MLALALFCAAAGVIVGGISSSARAVDRLKLEAQGADLVVTKLSEIQMGMLDAADAGPTPIEEPGLSEWTWQVSAVTLDTPGGVAMRRVQVTIAQPAKGYSRRASVLLAAGGGGATP